jgi:methanogenic corrinoid protein MtbC1
MIRWCSYCQALMGEVPPLRSIEITHGICAPCGARLNAGDEVGDALVAATEEVRDLMNRIFECAARADERNIPTLLAEAAARKLPSASVLIGLLQPALYRAGDAWRDGGMSVAAEHRLTLWCERFFSQLPAQQPVKALLDLIIFMMPGNPHTLGPRFAAYLLLARGISTQAIVPELPIGDMVEEVERLRPRVIGISCALATSLPAADELLNELGNRIDPSWPRRFLLGGFALRGDAASTWVSASGAVVVATIQQVEDMLS